MNDSKQPTTEPQYFVKVTLKIPHRLLGRITKKTIQSRDVEIIAVDWDKVRSTTSIYG